MSDDVYEWRRKLSPFLERLRLISKGIRGGLPLEDERASSLFSLLVDIAHVSSSVAELMFSLQAVEYEFCRSIDSPLGRFNSLREFDWDSCLLASCAMQSVLRQGVRIGLEFEFPLEEAASQAAERWREMLFIEDRKVYAKNAGDAFVVGRDSSIWSRGGALRQCEISTPIIAAFNDETEARAFHILPRCLLLFLFLEASFGALCHSSCGCHVHFSFGIEDLTQSFKDTPLYEGFRDVLLSGDIDSSSDAQSFSKERIRTPKRGERFSRMIAIGAGLGRPFSNDMRRFFPRRCSGEFAEADSGWQAAERKYGTIRYLGESMAAATPHWEIRCPPAASSFNGAFRCAFMCVSDALIRLKAARAFARSDAVGEAARSAAERDAAFLGCPECDFIRMNELYLSGIRAVARGWRNVAGVRYLAEEGRQEFPPVVFLKKRYWSDIAIEDLCEYIRRAASGALLNSAEMEARERAFQYAWRGGSWNILDGTEFARLLLSLSDAACPSAADDAARLFFPRGRADAVAYGRLPTSCGYLKLKRLGEAALFAPFEIKVKRMEYSNK